MWQLSYEEKDLGALGNMQNFDCDSKLPNMGNYGTVNDTRDNTNYRVAKLKDGKCWMTQNLKIAGKTITSSDSDVSSSFTIPSSNISAFNTTSYSNTNNSAAYVDGTYGGYYTWYTATAGTGTSSMTTKNQNATGSICPKGWKLPTSGSDTNSSDFGKLVTAYGGDNSTGSSTLRTTPVPGFTFSGDVYYASGSLNYQGSRGYYWSSTVYNSTYEYHLYLLSSHAGPAYSDFRVNGQSVRCVAREYKSMQKINEWKDELQEEQVVEARDERDGNIYKVAKLKDGKIWMVENLRLVGEKILTSSDSDVSSSFTLPASSSSTWNGNYNTAYVHKATNSGYTDQVYYSWYAATAGTGGSSTGAGVNASSSICPKGWRLPKGGSGGEFQTLYSHYNSSAAMRATPVPNFTFSGAYLSGSERDQGGIGYCWSSTSYGPASSLYNAYRLYLDSSFVESVNSDYQVYGYSVRCLAS